MKKLNVIQKDFQILLFINKYNWEGVNYTSKIDNLYIKEK